MKRTTIIVISLAVGILFVPGCGKKETVYMGPEGGAIVTTEKTVDGEKQTVKVKTKDGSGTYTAETKKNVTEAELGAPVYPGAEAAVSAEYEGSEAGQTASVKTHTLTTKDSFDKVFEFYKSRMKNAQSHVMSDKDGQKGILVVEDDKGATVINIARGNDESQTTINVGKTLKQ